MRHFVTKRTHGAAVDFNPAVSQWLTILCSYVKVGITGSFPLVTLSECDFFSLYVFHRMDTDDNLFKHLKIFCFIICVSYVTHFHPLSHVGVQL